MDWNNWIYVCRHWKCLYLGSCWGIYNSVFNITNKRILFWLFLGLGLVFINFRKLYWRPYDRQRNRTNFHGYAWSMFSNGFIYVLLCAKTKITTQLICLNFRRKSKRYKTWLTLQKSIETYKVVVLKKSSAFDSAFVLSWCQLCLLEHFINSNSCLSVGKFERVRKQITQKCVVWDVLFWNWWMLWRIYLWINIRQSRVKAIHCL